MATSLARRFGARLRALREGKGLTQAALAEAVDVSVNCVSALERGQRLPTIETMVKLAKAVGAKPAGLLGDTSQEPWVDEVLAVASTVPKKRRALTLAVLRALAIS